MNSSLLIAKDGALSVPDEINRWSFDAICYANAAYNFIGILRHSLSEMGFCRTNHFDREEFKALAKWRNKVAAHSAQSNTRGEPPETLFASQMCCPVIVNGRLTIGLIRFNAYGSSDSCPIQEQWPWAISGVHPLFFEELSLIAGDLDHGVQGVES